MIKVFTTNKDNKIELSADELKKLLDEAYWEGFRNNNHVYVYNTPSWSPYSFTTCTTDSTINASNVTLTSNACEVSNG